MKLLYYRLFKGLTCAHWPCKRCDAAGRTSWRSRKAWHAQRPVRRFLAKVRQVLYRHDPIERGIYVPFGGAR